MQVGFTHFVNIAFSKDIYKSLQIISHFSTWAELTFELSNCTLVGIGLHVDSNKLLFCIVFHCSSTLYVKTERLFFPTVSNKCNSTFTESMHNHLTTANN